MAVEGFCQGWLRLPNCFTTNPWVHWSMSWLTTWFWFRDTFPRCCRIPAEPQCQSPEVGQIKSPFSRTCQIGLVHIHVHPNEWKKNWFRMGMPVWELIQNKHFFGSRTFSKSCVAKMTMWSKGEKQSKQPVVWVWRIAGFRTQKLSKQCVY